MCLIEARGIYVVYKVINGVLLRGIVQHCEHWRGAGGFMGY